MDNSWDILNAMMHRIAMKNLTMLATPYLKSGLESSMIWATPWISSGLTWGNYVWDEMTVAVQQMQKNHILMGVVAVWLVTSFINTILLIDQALYPPQESFIPDDTYMKMERRITRSMTRAARYKQAATPAVHRRRQMILSPLN